MELSVKNINKNDLTKVEISDVLLQQDFNMTLVHQSVVAYKAKRISTKAQKSRAEVSGGGKKPWKQKGTGRARAGSTRSPLWRHGGRAFAAKPRNHEQKINRKMYSKAICSIISELYRQDRLLVIDSLSGLVSSPKTKEILVLLNSKFELPNSERILFIDKEIDMNLYLAGRNLPNLSYLELSSLNPVSLVYADKVVISLEALRTLEERVA